MNINIKSLKKHLLGHGVPNAVVAQVLAEIAPLRQTETFVVYDALGSLKQRLIQISQDPSLTTRQAKLITRCYLVLNGDTTTTSHQMEKEYDAINCMSPSGAILDQTWSYIARGAQGFGKVDEMKLEHIHPIYQKLYAKVAKNVTVPKNDPQLFIKTVVAKSKRRIQRELQHWSQLPPHLKQMKCWDNVFKGIHLILDPMKAAEKKPSFVGTINLEQEPGMKLRLSASPWIMYQTALEPLKRSLQRICYNLEQDCHKDQIVGAVWAAQQLMFNHTVYSFDLSSATHRFPWEIQLRLMKLLGVPKVVLDLFTYVSKGQWNCSATGCENTLEWKTGQPLGTGPSFFAFSLAHHALVRGICADLRVNVDCYRILGDDIVINNKRVANKYEEVMNQLGATINRSKSIISNEVAEFAGYTITSEEMFRTGKLRTITKDNLYELARDWSNRDVLSIEDQDTISTVEMFNAYNPGVAECENALAPNVHGYINLKHAHAMFDTVEFPETVMIWDFATDVLGCIPEHIMDPRGALYGYYNRQMRILADEIVSYLPVSEWVMSTRAPSFRIITGIRDLMIQLGSCPTQCKFPWVDKLMERRGGKPTFMRVKRTLIKLATAFVLTIPSKSENRNGKRLYQFHKQALALLAEGNLDAVVSELQGIETLRGTVFIATTAMRPHKVTIPQGSGNEGFDQINSDFAFKHMVW